MQAHQIEGSPGPAGSDAPLCATSTACFSCQMRHACSPCGLTSIDPQLRHLLVFSRHRLRTGEKLYRSGDAFRVMHTVRSGSLKSDMTRTQGPGQVCGFHLPGDVMGLDGVADDRHPTTATALEDTQTCAVAFGPLFDLSLRLPLVQKTLHRLMSQEVSRSKWHMLLLGSMSAPERLAALLLDLSRRAARRGYSPTEFNLRMTRSDIGSYLGITAETVCRLLRGFAATKLLEVDTRHIRFLDLPAFARTYGATVNWRSAGPLAARCA